MSGETDLATLLRGMSARLDPQLYVFVTTEAPLPDGLAPLMLFREAEGVTLVLPRVEADRHGLAHAFPCRRITLEVHSALEAVGFIARIATVLSAHGMGVNPVSAFHHDHLFVPDGRQDEAMEILSRLAAEG